MPKTRQQKEKKEEKNNTRATHEPFILWWWTIRMRFAEKGSALHMGRPLLTHHGPTSIGEWGGGTSDRAQAAVALFAGAGYDAREDTDIQTKIWSKAVLNAAINPLCAASGLRLGEMARTPEMNALQDNVLRELFGA